jgi:hypothetical protein|tara:strand:- start:126 stop:599 length:474 start_codon:yes stop_codon:yes gene_type:complete
MSEVIIKLNQTEKEICAKVGMRRQLTNRALGTVNQKVHTKDSFEVDRDGFAGELAFCKIFKLYPDFGNTRADADVFHPELKWVDVKTAPEAHHNLLVRQPKADHPADTYALMLGKWETGVFSYVGYATKEMVFKDDNLVDPGFGICHMIKRKDLILP